MKVNVTDIYAAEDPRFVHFPSRRSVVHSTKGMISSSQPLANEAGQRIMMAGGNAADAAVAVAAALNVTEPSSTGIGGDMFCLYYDAKTKTTRAMNGSGRSPAALSLAKARELGIKGNEIPFENINAATVPGACAGWFDTVATFGSGQVTMEQILTPAIELAEGGFPVSEISAFQWNASEAFIKAASPSGHEILRNGKAPKAGEVMRNPTLARTFREISTGGRDAFYKGRIAQEIVDLVTSLGGVMTLEDLAGHTSTPCDPISMSYNGLRIWEHPPNGQGLVALIGLGLIKSLGQQGRLPSLAPEKHNSVAYLHMLIEVLRLAFADGRYYISDPATNQVPVTQLLSDAYLSSRASIFNEKKATVEITKGSPQNSSDTVYFSTVDKEGNACSFIISNYAGFGTAAVPRGCGFTLQNRGCNFVLKDGHPNVLAPNKRPYHTIIPAMVTREDGSLWANFGCMGAFMQPQGQIQLLMNMLHFGHTPQSALDAPRICVGAAIPDVDGNIESRVFIEDGIPDETLEKLREMGHDVVRLRGFERGMFGRGQIIRAHREEDGTRVLSAGSDPRGDGAAIPVMY